MNSPSDARPIRQLILEQVRSALAVKQLGVDILTAEQGMFISKRAMFCSLILKQFPEI